VKKKLQGDRKKARGKMFERHVEEARDVTTGVRLNPEGYPRRGGRDRGKGTPEGNNIFPVTKMDQYAATKRGKRRFREETTRRWKKGEAKRRRNVEGTPTTFPLKKEGEAFAVKTLGTRLLFLGENLLEDSLHQRFRDRSGGSKKGSLQ